MIYKNYIIDIRLVTVSDKYKNNPIRNTKKEIEIMSDLEMLRSYEVRENITLKRVMPLDTFRRVLDSRSLYFSPASNFEDELEGKYTEQDHAARDNQLVNWGFRKAGRITAREAKTIGENHNAKATVISCWTKAQTLSDRIWTEYSRSQNSIAIQSSIDDLRNAIGTEFLFIPVRYIDEADSTPKNHSIEPFFFKRRERFSWEDELRIVGNMEIGKRIGLPRLVPVNLQDVISRIILPPTSSEEYQSQIQEILNEKELTIPVEKE